MPGAFATATSQRAEVLVSQIATAAPQLRRIVLDGSAALASRRQLKRTVSAAIEEGSQRVVLDCSRWARMDLVLLSTLVYCANTCTEAGVTFEMQNVARDLLASIDSLHLRSKLHLLG